MKKKHRPRTVKRLENKCARRKVLCPECLSEIIGFPRHLRDAHDYSRQSSVATAKKLEYKLREMMPKRQRKVCPVEGCPGRVIWLGQHLSEVHQMEMTERKEYMAKAKMEASSSSEGECIYIQ